MIEQLHKPAERSANRQRAAHWLYFRRFLKNPVGVASVTPSSPALGRLVAQHVCREDDEYVVEPGRSEEHTSDLQSLMRISYAVLCLITKITHEHSLIQTTAHSTVKH